MSGKLMLVAMLVLGAGSSVAATVPLQPVFTDNLIVIPYFDTSGEARAEFLYRLDDDVSRFNQFELSGWLSVDAPQSVQDGDFANRFTLGYHLLDAIDFTAQAFWWDPSMDAMDVYVSDTAMAGGQADFHLLEFPNYGSSGSLGFTPNGDFSAGTHGVPFICIECGLDVYLNFLFMDYSTGELQLNLTDGRSQVFFGTDFFEGSNPYGWNMNMSARPVPLPAAVWLMLSALLLVPGGRCSRSASPRPVPMSCGGVNLSSGHLFDSGPSERLA